MRRVLAVDLGGTKILACVVEGSRVLASAKTKTGADDGVRAVVRRIVETGREALEDAGLDLADVAAVGVAVPGAVDEATGVVLEAPNLSWTRFKARETLARAFGRPVAVANDANAGLAGELAHGALKPYVGMPTAGFFVGTGVGGAFSVDGKVASGSQGLAGEFGHMTIETDGPRCGCGNHGCLEAFASRLAIEKALKKRRGQATSRKLKKAYKKGDGETRKVVRRAADYLGIGVANVMNLLNPRAVVLGGGLIEALGDEMLPRVVRSAESRALSAAFRGCRIVLSKLGDAAVPVGAAALALSATRS